MNVGQSEHEAKLTTTLRSLFQKIFSSFVDISSSLSVTNHVSQTYAIYEMRRGE
jgi:hypothetical protein